VLVLRERLDELYYEYNRRRYVTPDPLQYLYRFRNVRDREIAGIVASSLAFGGVDQINRSISDVLDVLTDGGSEKPSVVLSSMRAAGMRKRLAGFRHRWVKGADVVDFLQSVNRVIKKYGSIEGCFVHHMRNGNGDIKSAIDGFIAELGDGNDGSGKNRGGLLPRAGSSSACKRINLFLRWMVRRDDVDPGGWKKIWPEKLVYPVDTHIRYLAEKLGITSRKTVSFKMAEEITEVFGVISPGDPVKYDFTLTRFGIRSDLDVDDLLRRLRI